MSHGSSDYKNVEDSVARHVKVKYTRPTALCKSTHKEVSASEIEEYFEEEIPDQRVEIKMCLVALHYFPVENCDCTNSSLSNKQEGFDRI